MKTKLPKKFEDETPTIKKTKGLQYIQVYCAWLEFQIEKQNKNENK